jgi:peptidoglycan hydrolase CwlO-like protein
MKKICFLIITFLLITAFSKVSAQTCSSVEECTSKINDYTDQINKLQGQANTLKNQISQFDAQIRLTTLKISQTESQISLLGGRIDQVGDSVANLTNAFNNRAIETYKLSRFENGFSFILTSDDLFSAFSKTQYLKKVQDEDKRLLDKLIGAKITYEDQKKDQEDLQKTLQKQKSDLNSQKTAKNNLLSATKNDEGKYQQLLSSAKSQLDRFKNFTISQGGSSILSNQTKCDSWGCYYNQRDSAWGNMFLGGTSYLMKDSGCFITSVAMMASHVGRDIKPSDIAQISAAVTSGGDLKWSFDVKGVRVSISGASKYSLDSILASGKPVIAGLYSGPAHFIVILRKEGDKYIMHDPFLENGSSRPLTDKYSVNDITTLRIVNFN